PWGERVRMTSSGAGAAMSAVRLARALTGREVVIKFAGAYHGHSDGLLADAGSGLATVGIPSTPGGHPAPGGGGLGRPLGPPRRGLGPPRVAPGRGAARRAAAGQHGRRAA